MKNAREEYADIIDREHHVSKKRPPMSKASRAAQFAPFAALTEYDDLIEEAARATSEQAEIDDSAKEDLDRKLVYLMSHPELAARFTFFVPDEKKAGGKYVTEMGKIRSFDEFTHTVRLDNGKEIELDMVSRIEFDRE